LDALTGLAAGARTAKEPGPCEFRRRDVAREAGIAALDIGRVQEALTLCRAAVANSPDDAGLVCDLALAYCLADDDAEAQRCVAEAVRRDPRDRISATVHSFIQDVAWGRRNRPWKLSEAFSRK
jgi:Flp pilus assembly protein TadD